VKIWGRHTSINVQKVLWTCNELGISYQRIDIGGDFGGLNSREYRRLNPNGRIPVIEDDGFVLWESNSIVRYLAATRGMGSLCPSAARERADAERWMDWQLCHILPGLVTLFFGLIRTAPKERDVNAIEQARVRTEESWQILDEHLRERAFVAGEQFTMGDIPIGAFAYRWLALPIERPALPNLNAWYERLCTRPAFRANVMLPLR
jgi:glutathione S-transferase